MSKKTLSTPKAESQRMTNYRCVIPFYILYDLELNANHLRLYGQIEQLESNPNPRATASFSCKWLAEVLGVNQRNANKIAEKMVEKGYIEHIFIAGFGWIWRTKKAQVFDPNGVFNEENINTPLSLRDTPPVAERQVCPVAERHPNILEDNIPEVINKTLVRNSEKQELSTYQETYFPSPENISQHLSEQTESDETFEVFWQLYPVKKGKQRAKVAWFAQRCYKDVHMILTKLDEQVRKDRQFLDGYPPHPTTYIHGKRWEDEVVPPAPSRVKRQSFAELDQNSDWHKEFHKDRF